MELTKKMSLAEKKKKVEREFVQLDRELRLSNDQMIEQSHAWGRKCRLDVAFERRRAEWAGEEADLTEKIAISPHGAQYREIKLVDEVRRVLRSPHPRVHP
jgi:hypothetical protein